MNEQLDKRISKILFGVSGAIIVYWLAMGVIWLYNWFAGLPAYNAGWWVSVGQFCLHNLSIIVVAYLVICLQTAGVVEFRFRKNFLKAFLLGVVLTPLGMLIAWGRK